MLQPKLVWFPFVLLSVNIVLVTGIWLVPTVCDRHPCNNGGKCHLGLLPGTFKCSCADSWKGRTCTIKVEPCDIFPCKYGGTCTNINEDEFKCSCKGEYKGDTCAERIQCINPLDLLFVVDTAPKTKKRDFNDQRRYLLNLIDWFEISDRGTNAGLITFSYKSKTKVRFLPDKYSTTSSLKSAIGSLRKDMLQLFAGHVYSIATALELANKEVFKTDEKNRNSAKAIVLLTPQVALDGKLKAIKEAEKLKAKGVKIISIELANNLKEFWPWRPVYKFLEKISSPLKPIKSKYDDLDDHVRAVTKELCYYVPCESSPCENGAECDNVDVETFKCKCTEGWKGDTCEAKVLPCESFPCENGAECENADDDTFKCNCTEGWKGDTCEEKVLPCESSPCKNGAECENVDDDTFKCNCTEGWKGDTCEEKVLPCESSPCKNGAQCENVDDDTFKCNCTEGWKGDTCEEKVLPCESSPCKNGAECENIDDDTFKCNCTEGWKGDTCEEKELVPCESSPCKNGAECENVGDDTFKCNCIEGWKGNTCEVKVTLGGDLLNINDGECIVGNGEKPWC